MRNPRVSLDGMWVGDELADAVVADDFRDTGLPSTAAVRLALAEGIDAVDNAPQSLTDLFAFLDDEPDWVDHTRMDNAADVLIRHTAALGIVLGAASLVRGAGNTIAGKPLAITSRYVDQPAVRSVEVGEWLRTLLTPGGMRRDGDGFAYTVRVRLIHAHVRRAMHRTGKWDSAAWGVPIPQPYMAFTMAEFGHIALAAMARLGVRIADDDLADIYHLWRYVGHVIGMDPRLNPRNEADHVRIEELYRLTSPGPGDDDRDFVVALTDDYLVPELAAALGGPTSLSTAFSRRLMHAMQRVFIGDDAADALHIPRTRLTGLVSRIEPALAVTGRIRMVVRGGPARVTARGYVVRDHEMARMRKAYKLTHELVDDAPGAPVGAALGAGHQPRRAGSSNM